MAKIHDQIEQARQAGYSDDEIFSQIVKTEQGKAGLNASGEAGLREFLGLSPTTQDPNPATRYGKMIGGALAEGVGEVVGLPGTLIEGVNALLPDQLKHDSPILRSIPSGQDVRGWLRDLGVADRGEAAPQNFGEELLRSGSTGVGAALPFLLTGGMSAAPQLLGAGLGSGLVEGTVSEVMPDNPVASIMASIVGGFGGQSIVRALESNAWRMMVLKELEDAEVAWKDFELASPQLSAEREALRDNIVRAADETRAIQLDFVSKSAIAREAGPKAAIADVAEGLAPGALGWQDAGEALRSRALAWYEDELPKALDEAWKPVDDLVPKDTPTGLESFDETLGRINRQAGAAQPLVELLTPTLPSALQNKLKKIVEAQDMGLPGFTWNDVRQLRTALGEAMTNPKIMPSIGEKNIKALYAALTEDLGRTAARAGATDEWVAANDVSKGLFAIAEGPIAKVIDPASEAGVMAKRLADRGRTDAATLEALRLVTPEGVDALASAALREKGFKWTLLAPKAKEALVPDPTARSGVDSALFELDDVKAAVAADKVAATAVHKSTRQAAQDQFKAWKTAHAQQQVALKQRLANAAAAQKLLDSDDSMAASLSNISKVAAGGTLGGAALDLLGVNPDTLANTKLGAAVALGVPLLVRGTGKVWQDPVLLGGPIVGATQASAMERAERGY